VHEYPQNSYKVSILLTQKKKKFVLCVIFFYLKFLSGICWQLKAGSNKERANLLRSVTGYSLDSNKITQKIIE